MGEVYRGRDLALGRPVAIKVLAADLGEDAALVARFEREARAVASLSHPNVVAIHHLGQEEGRWYAVTELLAGQTLRARLAQGPISLRKQLRIGASVARGLAAAHARGIIHRDLKPENVFLTEDGQVKVLDFGLARWSDAGALRTSGEAATLTQAGVIVGTPGYMSPEQARGEALDERSDVFALGCVLFEMVARRPSRAWWRCCRRTSPRSRPRRRRSCASSSATAWSATSRGGCRRPTTWPCSWRRWRAPAAAPTPCPTRPSSCCGGGRRGACAGCRGRCSRSPSPRARRAGSSARRRRRPPSCAT